MKFIEKFFKNELAIDLGYCQHTHLSTRQRDTPERAFSGCDRSLRR